MIAGNRSCARRVAADVGPPCRIASRRVTMRGLVSVLFLAMASLAFAAPIAPDALFFAPVSMAKGFYPHQPMSGDPQTGPWVAVWTPADIVAQDPGRLDVSIVDADVLPVLLPNPATSEGEYSAADLAAINVTNYMTFYMQKPGTDLSNPAVDYVADLTSNTLTLTFKASAMYAVRVETTSRGTPAAPLESRAYIFTQYANDWYGEDGAPDAQSPNRKVELPEADLYIVSDGDPNDNGFCANAVKTLEGQGKTVCKAKTLAEAEACIKARSKALGRKIKVVMIGHGRPGSIKIGTERINDFADGVQTPAGFQGKIDDYVSDIEFFGCDTAQGDKGTKFLRDFANSIGIASGWTVPVTAGVGYFDVESGAKKGFDVGVHANEAVLSSPSTFRIDSFFDVFFYGSNDGFLYAQTVTGGIVPGFPVDTRDLGLAGATGPVGIRSRPAVYYGAGAGAGLYFTTVLGHVISVGTDGELRWAVRPDPTASNCSSTPAVTPDGSLFVAINGANGPCVWKLNASNGSTLGQTPALALPTSDSSSVAVAGNLVYLGVTEPFPGLGALFVLDTNLNIRAAGIAQNEGVAAPPFVNGPFMYDGTLAGNLYKVNSVTTSPDPTFGVGGRAPIGEPMRTSLFAVKASPATVDLYAGTEHGRVYRVLPTGLFDAVFDTKMHGGAAPIEGLVMVPAGGGHVMAFGAGRHFYEVATMNPLAPMVFPDRGLLDGGFSTTPAYAAGSQMFAIGNRDGYCYTFPRVIP